ncbi:ABC transporter permease [Propionivibrio soli]|uniref:ABC transporter permease n=1 Tax=Propionivibrio soli TaxID=2976531 RepID=UPI0021E98AA5|nr:ABC transporter permease [Propionivibrio soli]
MNNKTGQITGAGSSSLLRGAFGNYVGLIAALALMVVLFGSLSEYFFSAETFVTIANDIPAIAVTAVGMTFVLIIAGIDLSVGSVMALTAAVAGIAMVQWEWPLYLAVVVAMVVGTVAGLLNGAISVGWRIPSFIVTLGMLEVARGAAYIATDSRTQYIGEAVEWLSAPMFGGVSPAFLIAIVIVIVAHLVLTRSVFGRYMIGIGTNEEAMRLAGVDPRPIKIAVYAILGALAGLAGIMQSSRLEAADPNAGIGAELVVIASVVIGGTSLMGGRGSVISTFFGVLVISVLEAGLAQIGASEPTKRIITGCVIIAAVILDMYRERSRSRRT